MASLLANSSIAWSVAGLRFRKHTTLPLRFSLPHDAVGARIGLYQAVVLEILVHIDGIKCLAVKACQEHVHHQQDIDLPCLDPFADILVIPVEVVGGEIGRVGIVVVFDKAFEPIPTVLIDRPVCSCQ